MGALCFCIRGHLDENENSRSVDRQTIERTDTLVLIWLVDCRGWYFFGIWINTVASDDLEYLLMIFPEIPACLVGFLSDGNEIRV